MNHYIVTCYVDAPDENAVNTIMAAAANACGCVEMEIKNWIVDEDETPELHPGSNP